MMDHHEARHTEDGVGPTQTAEREVEEAAPPPSPPVPPAASGKRVALVAVILLATLWLGATIGPSVGAGLRKVWSAVAGHQHAPGEQSGATSYYTCGMHPWVILPRPGLCPICNMDLVPLDPAKFSGEVAISPVVAQNIGVRVEKVESGALNSSIRTVGIVEYDETRVADVNLKVAGWIEKLNVDYQGVQVRKGQVLMSLYSPELYSAQEEYLLALRAQRREAAGAPAGGLTARLLEAARTKLSYFDIGPAQIAALEKRGVPVKSMVIRSPHTGVVIEKHAFEGMKVTPGMTAYRIADLSRVWVMATLYEYQSQSVQVGQPATMTLSYDPGQSLEGKVSYVYPYLDKRTRQIKVRLEFPNPKLALKPGMYATVVLEGATSEDRVMVPRAAVIDTGERQVAFVSLGEGRFEPRAVRMGGETSDGKVEILEGLKEGELVVTSGQFLIDSESRMREALAKMMRGTPAADQPAAPAPASQPAAAALPAAAAAALGTALDAYLAAGAALSGDTTRDIGVQARKLAEALDAVLATSDPARPRLWQEHPQVSAARDAARALTGASNIEQARLTFFKLSAQLSGLLRATGVPAGYGKQLEELHCPMYPPGDKGGAVWLQAGGPARNPYFGKVMLTCADRRQALPTAARDGAPAAAGGEHRGH